MQNNNEHKVETTRQFEVSVEKLYSAWNDAEELKQWWKPLGNQLETVENDLSRGGKVRYVFSNNSLIISGTYDEVKPNEKLIYSWNWEFPNDETKNASYKLEIHFSGKESGSEIHVKQESLNADEKLHPNEHGWEHGLEDLANYLQSIAANGGSSQKITSDEPQDEAKAEEPGYREAPGQQKVGGG